MSSGHEIPRTPTTASTSAPTLAQRGARSRGSANVTSPQSSGQAIPLVRVTDSSLTTQPDANNRASSTEPFPSLSDDLPLRSPRQSQRIRINDPRQSQISNPLRQTVSNTLRPTSSNSLRPVQSASAAAAQRRIRPIGIKRLSSYNKSDPAESPSISLQPPQDGAVEARKRSFSAPQRPGMLNEDGGQLRQTHTAESRLANITEGEVQSSPTQGQGSEQSQRARADTGSSIGRRVSQRIRASSDAARSILSRDSDNDDTHARRGPDYESEVVDLLDVLDPEVSTLTTLTNVQNSLFVPDLGRWLNRRPTYELSPLTSKPLPKQPKVDAAAQTQKPLPPTPVPGVESRIPSQINEESEVDSVPSRRERGYSLVSVPSIASVVQEEHYAVLPHGVSLSGWSEEDKELLDDYVRHMLHSRRSRFKRSMKAFGKYVSKPLGFFVTLYATLITLFGLAWVLFLIGWIYVGSKQLYVINIIDNVLVALFAVVGDGLAPFRVVDTYHMCFIAHYHHLTWSLRKKKALPELQDHNDLPDQPAKALDMEAAKEVDAEFSVLTPQQQKKLEHHQEKFSKSHSFYKPHETTTHHAFPLRLLVAIVVLLDCHSLFQIALGTCTWAISYHTRPKALTPTILSCSITVNITAGILIKIGDSRTRKKDVLKRMYRQELTEEAMKKVEKHKGSVDIARPTPEHLNSEGSDEKRLVTTEEGSTRWSGTSRSTADSSHK